MLVCFLFIGWCVFVFSSFCFFFFCNDTATTEIYTLSLHDALPIYWATTFGVAICADIDTPEIFAQQARQGARIIFEAAAPGLYGEQETRNWRSGYEWWQSECHQKLGRYARENDIFIAVATQAGRTSDEDFPGGGYVFGPTGACLLSTEDWSENVLYAELPIA